MHAPRVLVLAALACALWVAPLQARDLNRQNYLLGEAPSGMGGAGLALTGDPIAAYMNPAGLAGLYRQGLSLSASAYQIHWENYRNVLDLAVIQADMNSRTFSIFPDSLVYSLPLDANVGPEAFHHVIALALVIPDYDKLDAKIDAVLRDGMGGGFDLKGSYFLEEMTYWAGPAYAVSFGGFLRLGLAAFALVTTSNARSNTGLKFKGPVEDEPGSPEATWYSTKSFQRSALSVNAVLQLGLQARLWRGLEAGLTIRSQTLGPIYAEGEDLMLASLTIEDAAGNPYPGFRPYVDRIETRASELRFRLPWMLALGLGYTEPGAYRVALDGSYHFPMSRYQHYQGPVVFPEDPSGLPILDLERALHPSEWRQTLGAFNLHAGAEVYLTEKLMLRLGAFTNFSVVDQAAYERQGQALEALFLPALDSFGVSLGGGFLGERTTTSVGVVYVYGAGQSFTFDELFGQPARRSSVEAHTLTVVVSGSANL
jgi:hypothetical protein